MHQDWPYCMKCSQVFRKGHLCFWSDDILISSFQISISCPFHGAVLVCIKANIFSWFNISTGSFSEVVCEIAKCICFGLSTNSVHQCLTFNCCYYEIPPASKIAAMSNLLLQGRFFSTSITNKQTFFWKLITWILLIAFITTSFLAD